MLGEIRTLHNLSTLRDSVPSFRRGCGFWPNCTGSMAVLPKDVVKLKATFTKSEADK